MTTASNPHGSQAPAACAETMVAQGGGEIHGPFREVVAPVHVATTYERAADGGYPGGVGYGRDQNPSFRAPEAMLARMEGAADALLFASGMAAATAVFRTLAPGARVVAPQAMYWALRGWLGAYAAETGVRVDLCEPTDAALAHALATPADLVWIETPANPTWEVIDIAAAARAAHAAGARLAVDSTVATPVLTRPLALGADLVMHSATKYLNGHSDVIAGMLATRADDAPWQRLRRYRAGDGAIAGPFEAWLLARGMRTLYLRVRHACASAQRIAEHFERHPAVHAVLYPGLASHPGHAVAARQMAGGFGAMLSIRVRGGAPAAQRVAGALTVFRRATSLGSTESLVEHRASVEGPGTRCPDDLLRLSIGTEAADDLVADLEHALAAATL